MGDVQDNLQADPGADFAPGTEVGGYIIDGKLGEGGMGVVYLAKQPRIGKRVAIKILARAFCGDPEVVARFEQEARVVNEIKHPNIVDVFQFGELPDQRSYFVMEYLDGEPLSTRIERGAIPTAEAIEILDVIADALQAAHEHNVVHRDLKSDNVFLVSVRGKRTVKLLDFGLAKLAGRGLEGASIGSTKQGVVVGTPAYMAPEQARSQPVDSRTDIYAFGILAFKMLTGKLPFRASNPMDLIMLQLNAPPPQAIGLAPDVPRELSTLIVKMMAKAPDDRPSLEDIRELFAELREHAPVREHREPVKQKKSPRPVSAVTELLPASTAERMERMVPSFGKVRMPTEEPAPARRRVPMAALILAGLAVVSVIGATLLVLHSRSSDSSLAAPATGSAEPTGSEPTGSVGSATATATAATNGSAAPPDTGSAESIELADDVVTKPAEPAAGSAVTTSTGSGTVSRRKKTESEDAVLDRANEAAEAPPVISRPGKIFLILQHSSMIEIDGKVVSQASQGGTFEVAPGEHQLKVLAPGRTAVHRTVNVAPGGSAVIRIADDGDAPSPAPAPPAPAAQ